MYSIEEFTADHMDIVLIPHKTVAHAQKEKKTIKWRQHVITHLEDVNKGSPKICEQWGSIVII